MSKHNLNLCEGHKQEWKQSHYADHNCDYCKLIQQRDQLLCAINQLEDVVSDFWTATCTNARGRDNNKATKLLALDIIRSAINSTQPENKPHD